MVNITHTLKNVPYDMCGVHECFNKMKVISELNKPGIIRWTCEEHKYLLNKPFRNDYVKNRICNDKVEVNLNVFKRTRHINQTTKSLEYNMVKNLGYNVQK
ncbi:MAG: hypothetical protein OHM56_03005 [Spiroplasma phoeniceum]|nr:MAG: hypothetical protein OHM57_02455 [Spiroplasma phoeniceum]UZQ32934.1 MAG: hypothetical protein OHM56_03005 [Spiroplasma phoeniceum]